MGKVLIVEDLLDCRQLLKRMIVYGYDEEAISVEDEDSAIQELRVWTPDFIIIDDYFLRKKEFISRLRSCFSGLIIGKTSKTVDASENVCDFYIFKPIDPGVFITFLGELKERIKVLKTPELHLWLSEQQVKFQPMNLDNLKVKPIETVSERDTRKPWWKVW